MSDEIDEDDISIRFGCQRVLDVIAEQLEGRPPAYKHVFLKRLADMLVSKQFMDRLEW